MELDGNLSIEQIKEKYFTGIETKEDYQREHLIMLAKSEEKRRVDGSYTNISEIFKQNSINRIKKYISNRTVEERKMKEYQVFINSMKESIVMLSC